jgi:hypothetical protein
MAQLPQQAEEDLQAGRQDRQMAQLPKQAEEEQQQKAELPQDRHEREVAQLQAKVGFTHRHSGSISATIRMERPPRGPFSISDEKNGHLCEPSPVSWRPIQQVSRSNIQTRA